MAKFEKWLKMLFLSEKRLLSVILLIMLYGCRFIIIFLLQLRIKGNFTRIFHGTSST